MLGMNQNQLTFEQIQLTMAQNPMIKQIIYTLIQNPMMMNQVMNIINVLNYNPVILNQMQNMMTQEMMINNQLVQMMNMMSTMSQSMMNDKPEPEFKYQSENIIIFFKKRGINNEEKEPIIIQCRKNEKVSDAIQKYRNISKDFEVEEKFIYNAMALNPSLTLEEANMTDRAYVNIVVTRGVKGG